MSTAHATYSLKTQLHNPKQANGTSSLPTRIVLTNIGLPSRSTGTPWTTLQKPLLIKPTVCTRYDMPFVHSNGHITTVASSGGSSPHDFLMVKRVKKAFSRLARKYCHKLKVAALKLANVCTPRHR